MKQNGGNGAPSATCAEDKMRPKTLQFRRLGFTLVEVLATMAIMSIVLPVAMKGIALCSNTASTVRRRSEAGALAEAKLNELIATAQWQSGILAGDFGTDWPDYSWKAEVQTWTPSNSTDNGYGNTVSELAVHITWVSRGAERSVTLSTLVYVAGGTSQ